MDGVGLNTLSVSVAGATGSTGCRRCFLGFLGGATAFEIGGVPAGTIKLEIGGGNLFFEGGLTTLRAGSRNSFADFAHQLGLVTTAGTLIIVNRHAKTPTTAEK